MFRHTALISKSKVKCLNSLSNPKDRSRARERKKSGSIEATSSAPNAGSLIRTTLTHAHRHGQTPVSQNLSEPTRHSRRCRGRDDIRRPIYMMTRRDSSPFSQHELNLLVSAWQMSRSSLPIRSSLDDDISLSQRVFQV